MTYSDFSLDQVRKNFGLQVITAALFPHLTPVPPSKSRPGKQNAYPAEP